MTGFVFVISASIPVTDGVLIQVSVARGASKDENVCSKYNPVPVAKHGNCWHLDRDCHYVKNSGHVCGLNPCAKCTVNFDCNVCLGL